MEELAGAVAAVTGGANGIGRAVATELAREGMHVALADIEEDDLAVAVDELHALGVPAIGVPTDVRRLEEVTAFAERVDRELGPVRLLVNNAGLGLIEPIVSTTDEDWHWIMDVNYFGVLHGVQAFLPGMLQLEGERHIMNVGSMAGMVTTRDLAGYNASKFAVVALTEAMREELADQGIGVSLLCPGVVGTRIMGRSRKFRSRQSRPAAPLGRAPERGDWEAVRVVPPDAVARLVLRGIRGNDLYLFTHPEERDRVASRFDRILAAFERDAAGEDGP